MTTDMASLFETVSVTNYQGYDKVNRYFIGDKNEEGYDYASLSFVRDKVSVNLVISLFIYD
jgi:hypothetical protein